MSLVVWLPLTKDLKQQGLSNVTVTNNGATFNENGKLGGCYKTSSIATIDLGYNGNQVNSGSLSFGGWFKFNKTELWSVMSDYSYNSTRTTPTGNLIGNNSYGGVSLQWFTNNIYNDNTLTTLYVQGYLRSTTNGARATSGVSLPFDTWVHIFFTFDKLSKVMTIWLNGEAKYTYTNLEFTDAISRNLLVNYNAVAGGNGPSFSIPFLINDIRIYDHCLSEMEIKQLSQGLVLHYPLNSNSTYTSLIDKETESYRIYNNYGVVASLEKLSEKYLNAPIYRLSMTPTDDTLYTFQHGLHSHGVYGWAQTFLASTKYVFWIYYRPVTHTDIRVGGTASNIGGWTEIVPEYAGNDWYRVGQFRNGNVTENKYDNIFTSFYSPTAEAGVPIKIDFACPTLVQGLTEIQPSINWDMGNIIYDNSGYCNNGTINGLLSNSSDTPKYKASTQFTGSQYVEASNEISTTDSTIAVWVNTTLAANGFILECRNSSGSGKQPIYQYTNGSIQAGGSGKYVTTNTGLLVANTWIHLAIVQSGDSILVYKNGQLFQTISCTNSPIIRPVLGARYTHSGGFTGQLSDLRIYATALSADDVKSLYQNCATIDPDGTIRGQIRS